MIPNTKSVAAVLPLFFLGVSLLVIIFVPIPDKSAETVKLIAVGLLGYVTKPEKSESNSPSAGASPAGDSDSSGT